MTFFYKFVFVTLWSGGFALGMLLSLARAQDGRGAGAWIAALTWLAITGLIWRVCGNLKRVALDGDTLVVSNYRREVRVPVREVAGVRQNRLVSFRPITITFKHPTAFGDHITFMPPMSFMLLSEDEVVVTLRSLATSATRQPL